MEPWTSYAWTVKGVKNLPSLLRALVIIAKQNDRIYLESPQDETVRNILLPLSSKIPQISIISGSMRVRDEELFHIPSTPDNIQLLIRLAETYSSPEVCMHLVLYEKDQILLEAYDTPTGDITINESLPIEKVNEFCKISGGQLLRT